VNQSCLCLVTLFLVGLCVGSAMDAAEQAKQARNPVLWADVPDPAIIRVGRTYYMSSTTMHMSPGLPLMKSKDLVNWRLVSYAYDTLADNDALTLQSGRNAYGAGSWASSLRGWTKIGVLDFQNERLLIYFMFFLLGAPVLSAEGL
jgi:hypothetical protein